jgi:mannitol-1-phosphate/altronate dehydrogenase
VQADLLPGAAPFTVMSCDNIPGNGDVARRSFAAFAELRDRELGEWVDREVPFPNSMVEMVDRITPATTDVHRAEPARRCGCSTAAIRRWATWARWPATRTCTRCARTRCSAPSCTPTWMPRRRRRSPPCRASTLGEDGRPIEMVDRLRERLMAAARRQGEDPLAFVADRELFGDLVADARFAGTYRTTLELGRTRGARAALEEVLRGP